MAWAGREAGNAGARPWGWGGPSAPSPGLAAGTAGRPPGLGGRDGGNAERRRQRPASPLPG